MRTHPTAALGTALVAALALAACSTARTTTVESAGTVSPDVVPATASTLPSGSMLEVRLNQAVGTKISKVGDTFTASVQNAVHARNGDLVVPAGATVQGRVTALDDSDHAGDRALIRLDFDRLSFNGQSYDLDAAITRATPQQSGRDSRDETLRKAGIGAVAGGVLGAIVGDADLKDVAIGAAIGAAAGTIISLGGGDVESALPAGTPMTLRVTQTIALR